ncbi:MAG: hypothetical protein SFZ03_09455 [Candidatus Melainabacteria bacterium]|nr:hypothetical protein [Candidatus Melainabacteria bacterium]
MAEYAISGGVLVLVVLAALTALNFPERIGQFLANTLDGEYGGSSVRISTLGDF